MPTSAAARFGQTAVPFAYVGGDPSLDLVNTVDWVAGGLANERLTSYERWIRWAEGAGLRTRSEAQALLLRARSRPGEAAAALAGAFELRALLQRLFCELAAGRVSADVSRELDDRLAQALAQLGVTAGPRDGRRTPLLRWQWRRADERLDSPLWPVVWSAARLVTSDEARRIRACDGPDCGWVYVDLSRNHLRRWCEMRTCGTAAKSRRRRA